MTRRDRILLLAWSLYDFTVPPSTWRANPLNNRRESGRPAPSIKELCQVCDGDKVTRDRFGRETVCGDCLGRGWHLRDPYTRDGKGGDVDLAEQVLRTETRRVICDRCGGDGVWMHERCELCEGSGKRSVGRYVFQDAASRDEGGDEWDRAITRRNESGSYHEFELCLGELARRSRHLHRIFHAVHVAGTKHVDALLGVEHTWVEQAIRFLDAHMPREIKVPSGVVAAARRDPKANLLKARGKGAPLGYRDEDWKRRYEAGETLEEIAASSGVNTSTVSRAVRRVA